MKYCNNFVIQQVSKQHPIQSITIFQQNLILGTDAPITEINGCQQSPPSENGINGTASNLLGPAGLLQATRKRPFLAGGPRTSMTPTKRTVMGLLARARAAQAKQLPVASAAAFTMGASNFDEYVKM